MVVESFGVPPLPSEVILPFSGILIVEGAAGFNWPSVIAVAVAGGVVGAILAYEVGRWGGPLLIRKWGRWLYLDEKALDRMERYFEQYGPVTVFGARLVPVLRAYISYPAGAAEMPRARFAIYTGAGALPFAVLLVWLGTVLGSNYTVLQSYFGYLDIAVLAGIVAILGLFLLRLRRHILEMRGNAPAPPPP